MERSATDQGAHVRHRGHDHRHGPLARATILAAVVTGWIVAHPCMARADGDLRTESALVWGVAAFEVSAPLSLAALAAWEPEGFSSDRYILYTLPPIIAAAGVGYLSYRQEWATAIPRTVHGVIWGGAEGLLIGALIGGLSEGSGLGIGPWAYGLSAAGALAGGWLGATEIEPGAPTQYWFTGPIVGAAAGAGVSLVPALLLALNGHDRAAGQVFGWTTVTGLTAGFIFGLAVEPDASEPPAMAHRLAALLLSVPLRF